MRPLIIIFIVTALILPLSGCKKKTPPPPRKKAEVKKEVKVKPEKPRPLIEEETTKVNGYVYNPAGRRDPFSPLIVLKRKKKGTEEAQRPPGTLESYDIGDFSLLAIVKKGYRYYALLLAPDNKSFTVNEGDTIGLHNGKIEKILGDRVIIVEYTVDYKGNKKPREVVLELHKEG
jgi:type IV pilus assembly protein PilP